MFPKGHLRTLFPRARRSWFTLIWLDMKRSWWLAAAWGSHQLRSCLPIWPLGVRWAEHFPSGKISVFLSSGCPSFRPFEPPWLSSCSWVVIGAHSWRLRDIFIKLRCRWGGGGENRTDVSDEKGTADSLYLSPMVTSQWEPDAVSGGGASAGGVGGATGRRKTSGFFIRLFHAFPANVCSSAHRDCGSSKPGGVTTKAASVLTREVSATSVCAVTGPTRPLEMGFRACVEPRNDF